MFNVYGYKILCATTCTTVGPFIISCNDESCFLKVTDNFNVVATSTITDASDFFINYEGHPTCDFEFSISYRHSSPLGQEVKPIFRYLYAPVNILGKNDGPLMVRLDATDKHTKMTLHSRRMHTFIPVDTKNWLTSRDIFYISCKQRTFGRDSFICVMKPKNSQEYITCCVPTAEEHNDHHMLFRLLRATMRGNQQNSNDIELL